MKKLLTILFLPLLFACSNDDENNPPVLPEVQNEYTTGVDLSQSYLMEKPLPTFENEAFHALGYGYDITGKYAHPDWIRKKVVDPQKFEDDHYNKVLRDWGIFYHRGLGTITGTKDKVKEELLKELKIETNDVSTEYKNAFRGMFDTPFENDSTYTGLEYYYAINAFASSWYEHCFTFFSDKNFLLLHDYLTDEFKSDLASKPADEIIKLYGTHVMMDIEVGWRQDYYYKSSSKNDLERRMLYASAKYLSSSPGMWMSPSSDIYYEKENLYTEYVSGIDPVNEPNAWMFDITNYANKLTFEGREHNIDKESVVLVNWGTHSQRSPIIPIYEFVSDTAKREALQQAYQAYLSE